MPVATLLVHAALAVGLTLPAPGPTSAPYPSAPYPSAPYPSALYPFAVGERLRYTASLGYFEIGAATVSVARMERERGAEAFVLSAWGEGGPPGLRMRYEATSWTGTRRFSSLRFDRRITQGPRVQEHHYQIVADSGRYREIGSPQDWVTPADALDELAFLYYLRTMPLQTGRSYSIPRYFQTGYNPVRVTVTGREPVVLGDGSSVPCLVLQVAARGNTMGVWLSDDARRLPAQMVLPLPFGNVTLALATR